VDYIQSGESEDMQRLKSEGSRLIGGLIRNFCHNNQTCLIFYVVNLSNLAQLKLLEDIGCINSLRWMVGGCAGDKSPQDTTYPIIQNEGIIA
jgi:hypothetical protein